MRRLRIRFSTRSLALLIALLALPLMGWRIYRDDPEIHWMLLKLRFGDVRTRRAVALEIQGAAFRAALGTILGDDPADRQGRDALLRRRTRRAERLLPALVRATKDPDPECRINALKAASALASLYGSESMKDRVFRNSLAAMHDPDETVRAAAMASAPTGLGRRDAETLIGAYGAALSDPSVEVRRAAAEQSGMFAAVQPETQAEVAPILLRVLASREDAGVRARAISGLWVFGLDGRRDPAGPDVVPALVAALGDPEVEVRRKAADVLGRTTTDARNRPVSDWDLRKAAIIPAVERAMTDQDRTMREEAALALFGLGRRDPAIIELMEKGAGDPDRLRQYRFAKSIAAWKEESGITAEAAASPGEVHPTRGGEIGP